MKNLILILSIASLFIIGCQEELSVTSPSDTEISTNINKSWVQLPPKDPKSPTVEGRFKKSKNIRKDRGGWVTVSTGYWYQWFSNRSKELLISAVLYVPKGAFNDEDSKEISITIDESTCTATFEPHPFTFDKDLSFTLTYKNLDLSHYDLNNLDFAYFAENGQIEKAEYDKIEVDLGKGILRVKNAKIPHFSRFGFVN